MNLIIMKDGSWETRKVLKNTIGSIIGKLSLVQSS